MLRAVLLGLLCVSTAACKGKQDSAPATQSGPAGTVVDVTGAVTVAGKPLAKGATVAADDVVDTGADGHVIIELTHNQAKWELGPNKHEKVNASLAWSLAKNEGTAKPVDQDTSAAGRPAERSAADTEVTATKEAAPAPEHAAAAAPEAPAPAAAPAPPPPPPPPPTAQPSAAIGGRADIAAPGGGGGEESPAPAAKSRAAAAPPKPSKKVTVPADDYLKCLKGITALHLVLHGHASGKTTYEVTGGVKLPADAKACIDKVTAGIKIDDGAHAEIDVSN
jgi:hypothetical protein